MCLSQPESRRDDDDPKKENGFEKSLDRLRVGKVLAPYNACPKAEKEKPHLPKNGRGLPSSTLGKVEVGIRLDLRGNQQQDQARRFTNRSLRSGGSIVVASSKGGAILLRVQMRMEGGIGSLVSDEGEMNMLIQIRVLCVSDVGREAAGSGRIWKLGLGVSMEIGLRGQYGKWAHGPKLGLRASVATGLMGQCRNWALGPGETGLMGQYGNWAYGPKLGLGANVETGLWGQVKLGLWVSRNWAYGPIWKLGLWASVETGLRGQYGNWAYGPVNWALGPGETGLMGQAKLGLWANMEIGLMGQCRNWAYGPGETGLMGQYGKWAYGPKLGLRASVETGLMGQCKNWAYGPGETGLRGQVELGLWARWNWAFEILKWPDETGLLKP
ncbi:hypothetical protein V8G54_004414 [Vigna mungo]|uniref:Uncharacterized protein n=1 Tax=Vigna mungo TaxID=3915 RepID=A0AAQ3PE77_VIGMU